MNSDTSGHHWHHPDGGHPHRYPAARQSQRSTANVRKYTCPMHPEVVSDRPGNCPKCGMTLEPMMLRPSETKIIYTCPMHPEIEQDHPGQCPKCGMTLEPKTVGGVDEQEQREIRSLSIKFWVGLGLTIPVLILAMGKYIPPLNLHTLIPMAVSKWLELILSTPKFSGRARCSLPADGAPSSTGSLTCSR